MSVEMKMPNLSIRLRNALEADGISSMEALQSLTITQLLRTPNVGRKGVREILKVLGLIETIEPTLGELIERRDKRN